jgi:HAD superfamily hydrolase (TIGR01509 family)
MDPQGLIFDLDGTLIDSMPLHWRVWQGLLAKHGLKLSEERFYALGGVPSRDILRLLSAEQGVPLDPVRVAQEKESAYLELIPEIQALEPVVAIARQYHGQLPLAVASGGTRRAVNQALEAVHLRPLFTAVVTNEDVTRQKPAPDIFLEAARRLGVHPSVCRAYEDTDLGLQAIRAAGMEAVDVRRLLAEGCRAVA